MKMEIQLQVNSNQVLNKKSLMFMRKKKKLGHLLKKLVLSKNTISTEQ